MNMQSTDGTETTGPSSARGQPAPASSPVMKMRPAAAYLGLGVRTLCALTETGKLPRLQLSARRIGYLRADLDAYLAKQRG